jgi:hypothetical protein
LINDNHAAGCDEQARRFHNQSQARTTMAKHHSQFTSNVDKEPAETPATEVAVVETPKPVSNQKRWSVSNSTGESAEVEADTVEDVVRAFNATLGGNRTFTRKSLTITEL